MIESSKLEVINPIMTEVKNSNMGFDLTVTTTYVEAAIDDILNLPAKLVIDTLFLQEWVLDLKGSNTPPAYHHIQLFAKNDKRDIYIGAATGDVRVIVVADLDETGSVKYIYSDMSVPTPTGESYLQVKLFDIN